MNTRSSTSVVVPKVGSQSFQTHQIKRFVKNGSNSTSFVPSNIGSGTHSRQRSPVMGALGKEAKLFQATMPSAQTTLVININDKKLESLNGSFNLTMNIVPITPSEPESMKPQTHH